MRLTGLILIAALLVGCAEKKPKPSARIPLISGTHITFKNIQGSDCKIADVFLDAQSGAYVVVCK